MASFLQCAILIRHNFLLTPINLSHIEQFHRRYIWQTFDNRYLSNYKLICLLQELRRDRSIQFPSDVHRCGALVFYIVCCTEIGISLCTTRDPVRLELTDEQQHTASTRPVVNVALASGRICCCGALALPMEQALVDGIIVVHGRG